MIFSRIFFLLVSVFIVLTMVLLLTGCGGAIRGQRGDPRLWERNCAEECEEPTLVRVLERDGNESRIKVGIISISPPYVCRCD